MFTHAYLAARNSINSMVADDEHKARLLATVKKEVKQVMEESVTRKHIHEDSGSVTALCAAVEACLSQGLRRRALGLFKTSSTTALLHKIAKHCEEAAVISRRVQEIENADPTRRSSSSSDSVTKPTLKKGVSLPSVAPIPKYLWLRLALFEKQLAKIIDHLVTNASKYYDKDALVADDDFGNILSSLLVGPCALDYSRARNHDHYYTDPPADELVQRSKISSSHSTPPPVRRPIDFKRSLNTSAEECVNRPTSQYAKDYVESLHQNNKATLLFGKNNVHVLPPSANEQMPGYLGLYQNAHCLVIKWTPNQLMNGGTAEEVHDTSIYWDYALQVRLDEIVYVHCHQDSESGGTVILVGQDGVQRPPIHFPKGGHMLAFLSCIETGLLPRGRLDPPLWSQRGGQNKKKKRPLPALAETEEMNKDYVFRIIDNLNSNMTIPKRNELMDTHAKLPTKMRVQLASSSTSSESSTKSFSMDQAQLGPPSPPTVCIRAVCDSMKRQIISRAFYGWLAYCRHLNTVRTHLSGLVNTEIINDEGAKDGITPEKWSELCADGVCANGAEVFRLAYFGGVANDDLRREIWPYLLGHWKFGSTIDERNVLNEETKQAYENTMSEWLAVEAIVKQRDKETQAIAIAKLSSESVSGDQAPHKIPSELSNEVFEDDVSDYEYISNEELSSNDEENDPGDEKDAKPNNKKPKKQNTIKYTGSDGECEGDAEEASIALCAEDENNAQPTCFDVHEVIVTNASVDICMGIDKDGNLTSDLDSVQEEAAMLDSCLETHGLVSPACVSPASSNGGVYSTELLNNFGLNLHRIEKDVQRCDRNFWYFAGENLDKLRNVMCTYVWEHLDIGYMQGMCDLVAPLLVIFNDESLTYACFCHLMERMIENFPNGNAMDCHFANMRSLIQILDSEMYELMHAHGDYTHFYFCYRWFLLDFKRELVYDDVYAAWETIWAAQRISSGHFVLFLALAFLETYRDIILGNCMDFTDIIKFFNEMAERHDAASVIKLARELVLQLQLLIENK
ncbi:small G protein signaling modulator 1-like [Atheta coriaria]|uniref:small G protein signaling modulator 1-like n=1 Tax=Dalotia coriaria TaxID=877792 RepID=UPI0031F4397B